MKKILQASYLNQKEASNKFQKLGFKYDPELSSNDNKVFVDKHGNPNIAFRGTHKLRAKDILSDVAVATGLHKYDSRFKEAKHLTKLVEDKYGKPANVYGDSLGGKLSEESGAHGNIITHNKATGILDIGKNIPKRQTDYRNKNDAVSLLSLTQSHNHNNLIEKDTGKQALDILGNHKITF